MKRYIDRKKPVAMTERCARLFRSGQQKRNKAELERLPLEVLALFPTRKEREESWLMVDLFSRSGLKNFGSSRQELGLLPQ